MMVGRIVGVSGFLGVLFCAMAGAATPVSFTIHGPSQVHELTSADYTAVIAWSDGTRSKASAFWSSSNPSVAAVLGSGRLQAAPVPANTGVTVTANYFGAGGPLSATANVSILDASTFPSVVHSLAHGWNLAGNSIGAPMNVVAMFGDQARPVTGVTDAILSVWKWDSVNSKWAFFSPTMTPTQLATYASSKGYAVLQVVHPGEGFWVNAERPVALPPRVSGSVSLASNGIVNGWNLLSTGQTLSPSALNAAVAQSFLSLWAWDVGTAKWLFYAPSLEASGGLAAVKAHADSNGYLDFPTVGRNLGHGTGFWINSTTSNPGSNLAPMGQAKAMFSELRTTVRAYTNDLHDGFLNAQSNRIRNELQGKVGVGLDRTVNYLETLRAAMRLFDNIRDGNTSKYGVGTGAGGAGFVRAVLLTNSPSSIGCNSNDFPSAGGVTPAGLVSVTCSYTPGLTKFSGATRVVNVHRAQVTAGATVSDFNWQGTRQYRSQTWNGTFYTTTMSSATLPGTYNGAFSRTYLSGTTNTSAFSVAGDFPPSDGAADRDVVNISGTRTVQNATTGIYRNSLTGSVTSRTAGGVSMVTLSLGSGSYIDRYEFADGSLQSDPLAAIRFAGVAETSQSRLTGTLELLGYDYEASGTETLPVSSVFDGSVADLSSGGAGVFMTGRFTMTLNNLATYSSLLPESSGNFLRYDTSFIGTLNAPSRPELRLTTGTSRTGVAAHTINTNYTYGPISVTGAGTLDTANADNSTLTLTNQAGVTVVFQPHADATVSKDGVNLGVIPFGSGAVYFTDGYFESL